MHQTTSKRFIFTKTIIGISSQAFAGQQTEPFELQADKRFPLLAPMNEAIARLPFERRLRLNIYKRSYLAINVKINQYSTGVLEIWHVPNPLKR